MRDFDIIPEAALEEEDFSLPKFRHVPGGKVYTDDNNDRFGRPILPSKPADETPAPGQYHPFCEVRDMGMQSLPFEPAKQFAQAERQTLALDKQGLPGPAYYKNTLKEPEKISFLFNPAEKWV